MTLTILKIRCLLPCAVALLVAACAPLTAPPQTEYAVGRARLVMPPGAWEDLGSLDGAVGPAALQARTMGLRGAQGQWLAVLRVQTNRTGNLSGSAPWTNHCPPQRDVTVEDAAAGSPLRVDCLRFKRWAGSDQWLEKNEPEIAGWLAAREIAFGQPYSHLSFRYAVDNGALVVVDAVVDHRLLHPRTHTNAEFLAAGRPALQWAHELAQAARLSVGMLDGYLAVPPFPFPAPPATP